MADIASANGEEPATGQEAPGRLELVRAFVNSVDLEDRKDDFGSASALAAWLFERGLLGRGARVSAQDLTRAIALREALRALLLANHDDDSMPPAAAVEAIEATARRSGLGLSFAPDGFARVASGAGGVDGAMGDLLAIVAAAQADGTWRRLKACPWDTCRWAFYDHSRNRSGVWCDMAVCGNRAKVRAYRERHGKDAARQA
jgi:predicted RNA-binding Zn ribbon-like protein